MPGASSSGAAWSTRFDPARRPEIVLQRPDDPRLAEVIEFWRGDPAALCPGRAVLIGFPQDQGVRRNHGRTGAAEAPHQIRTHLWRLTPFDPETGADLAALPPLDLGDIRVTADLEESQQALAEVVAVVLQSGAVPVVLGGGHETAYGHYLGHVAAGRPVGIINLDAHLDVRPTLGEHGHSGSPFRQALDHPAHPLPGDRYVCLGAQPQAVSRQHAEEAARRGCVIRWCAAVRGRLGEEFRAQCERLAGQGASVYVTLDADVVSAADVPGVSAPNALGLSGEEVAACARLAGQTAAVSSFDLVEINPRQDRDGQSARWAAVAVWQFLAGVASRR